MKNLLDSLKTILPYSVVEVSWKAFINDNQIDEEFLTIFRLLPWEKWRVLDPGSEYLWKFNDEFDFFAIRPKKTYVATYFPRKEGYTSTELNQSSLLEVDCQLRELQNIGIVQQKENRWYLNAELLRLNMQHQFKEANPYRPNSVVTKDNFKGREEALIRLKEFWTREKVQSTLIYGQRRTGKTSLVRNAAYNFYPKVIVADFNLQILGSLNSEGQMVGEFLLGIADSIQEATAIKPPSDKEILEQPYEAFRGYLATLEEQLQSNLIITLNEFEKLQIWIREEKIPETFTDYLAECISSKTGFAVIAGHSPEKMFRTYFKNFFDKLVPIQVRGFLSLEETRTVLTQFRHYTDDVVEKIYQLTNGQPLLVQTIGFQLVSRYPKVRFFTGKHLDEVFAEGKILNSGATYFRFLWRKASDCLAFQKITVILSSEPEGLTYEELRTKLDAITRDISDNLLSSSLDILEESEIIVNREERWVIAIELFRLWILQEKPHYELA